MRVVDEGWSGPWPAPAKLNLFLHILGRRSDGFHDLQTLFQLLDYGDRLFFRLREDGAVHRHGGLPGLAEDDDLVVRAALLLMRESAMHSGVGVDIRVDKQLPAGAGLGGGSSDAATTLLVLNRLWHCGYSIADLERLGLALGADVPVFVRGQTAWAEGLGEQLLPIAMPQRWFVVVDPAESVATGELFAEPTLTRDCLALTMESFAAGAPTVNVFEPVVLRRSFRVRAAFEWLKTQVGAARLTGTGGCVFAALDDPDQARALAARCPEPFNAFAAAGVAISPLQQILDRELPA